jgi:hypothetical protein
MRRMSVVAGAAALVTGVAACGGDSEGDTETDTDTIAVSSEMGGGAELFQAMADAQLEAGSFAFEMRLDVEGEQVTGSGAAQYGDDLASVELTMTMDVAGEGEMAARLVDGRFFITMPPEAGLPTEKTWLTIDPSGDDPLSRAFGAQVDKLADSTAVTEQLVQNAEVYTVEEVGPDTIDGVEVTEYLLTADPEDAAQILPLPPGEAPPVDELTFSLWVDGDALPRRMSSDLDGYGAMEMTFFDYREPVEVEAPPADQVTDFATMLEEELGVSLDDLSEEELAELESLLGGDS